MNDLELKEIDNLVIKLRIVENLLQSSCSTEVAEIADVACFSINKACRLINRLTQENLNLKHDSDIH
jgi:Trp operon repressor